MTSIVDLGKSIQKVFKTLDSVSSWLWQSLKYDDSSSQPKNEYALEATKTIISVFGLVGTLGTICILLLNYKNAQNRLEREQFFKAVEQLDKDKTVRIGAIYTLKGIATDSPQKNHQPIMEILAYYIRQNAAIRENNKDELLKPVPLPQKYWDMPKNWHENKTWIPSDKLKEYLKIYENYSQIGLDIQVARNTIAKRSTKKDPKNKFIWIDLNNTFLVNSHLEGAKLQNTNLGGVDLYDSNLKKANLTKSELKGSRLIKANLIEAELRDAIIEGAILIETNLTKANLTKADLNGAILQEANLAKANLTKANLTKANLTKANLIRANFTGEKQDENSFAKGLNFDFKTIKSACYWEKAIYYSDRQENKDFIKKLEEDDTKSSPKSDCEKIWDKNR